MNANTRLRRTTLCAACLMTAACAWAHKPAVIDGGPTTAETAHPVEDITVSQVGYHEATATQPEMWFTFHAEAGQTLYLQAGVPRIERYADLRPIVAVLGPGLPAIDVPFDLPEGYGGWVFSNEGVEPVEFDEEFTGTLSWQFPEVEQTLPATAQYYMVGYLPNGQEGKFWMALGRAEVFGLSDILTLPIVLFQVRSFHEIGPFGGILFWAYLLLIALIAGGASILSAAAG